MEMAKSRDGYEDDKPLWKERRGHLLHFTHHNATEKENSGNNLGKTKEKERAKNQAVTRRFLGRVGRTPPIAHIHLATVPIAISERG